MTEIFSGTMAEMDLIERHILMLKVTKESQPVGIIRLSELTGLPKHKVRYSLRLLEKDGLIVATQEGATVSDKYDEFMANLSKRLDEIISRVDAMREKIAKSSPKIFIWVFHWHSLSRCSSVGRACDC